MYYILDKKTRELKGTTKTRFQANKLKYELLKKHGIKVVIKKDSVSQKTSIKKDLDKECEKLWVSINLFDAVYRCEYCGAKYNLQVDQEMALHRNQRLCHQHKHSQLLQ